MGRGSAIIPPTASTPSSIWNACACAAETIYCFRVRRSGGSTIMVSFANGSMRAIRAFGRIKTAFCSTYSKKATVRLAMSDTVNQVLELDALRANLSSLARDQEQLHEQLL